MRLWGSYPPSSEHLISTLTDLSEAYLGSLACLFIANRSFKLTLSNFLAVKGLVTLRVYSNSSLEIELWLYR